MSIKSITPAKILWDQQGLPRSEVFDDVYFSEKNGLEETRYVFLAGNDLENRWKALEPQSQFVICETGFGTGLNLIAAAELWQKTAPKSAHLHFISTELYPLRSEDLKKALNLWPELSDLSAQLIKNYPALTPGFHRFSLTESISVTLIFDEVVEGLSSLCPTLATEMWSYQNWAVDAWFLDGFAPSRNPEIWAVKIFSFINRLSSKDATVATFTSAAVAKNGLKNWGFDLQKLPGFGAKREMLTARRNAKLSTDLGLKKISYRGSSPCWHLDEQQSKKPQSIAIIGAGIAGCSIAEALSRRNISSTIFDSENVAKGASGFPQAGLYARLSPDQGDLEDFCLQALNYTRGFYQNQSKLIDDPEVINLCGLIQLPKSNPEQEKMRLIANRFSHAHVLVSYKNKNELEQLCGKKLNSDGLWFPNCGWVDGPSVCQNLIEQSKAKLRENITVSNIIEGENSVQLIAKNGSSLGDFDAVIICTATQAPPIEKADWLPIRPIRGQISFLKNQTGVEKLKAVVCKKTSVSPMNKAGVNSVGATYDIDQNSSALKLQDHATNLKQLQDLLSLDEPLAINLESLTGRAATRATTPDYLPLVGSLPNIERFMMRFNLWTKDRKRPIPELSPNHKGVYLNLGYGSRGYTYAPYCAEILAAQIANEPEPASIEMQRALNPSRFLVRSLSRNRPLI